MTDSAKALPCIVCGRELFNVVEGSVNQPSDGLSFSSHGAYGSTVFDPMDGSHLEINVCDKCLMRQGDRKRVYAGRYIRLVFEDGAVVGQTPIRPEALWYWPATQRVTDS